MLKSVTLVITSCGRLDLLKRTVDSLFTYYQFPKERFIIIEDSAKAEIISQLKLVFGGSATLIINEKNIGLLASVDKAYQQIRTPYIFHCEDDWEFYRQGFIEESIAMLETDKTLKQVNLRSIFHDYIVNHPLDIVPKRLHIANIACYKIKIPDNFDVSKIPTKYSKTEFDWSCFSFNPGVLRKSDYDLIGTYSKTSKSEAEISSWYKLHGFYMVALENDAVLHIGWGSSLEGHDRPKTNLRKRFKNLIKALFNIFDNRFTYEH